MQNTFVYGGAPPGYFGSMPAFSLGGGRNVFASSSPGITLLSGGNPAQLPGAGMYPTDDLGSPQAFLAAQPNNLPINVAGSYPNWFALRPAIQEQMGYSDRMNNWLTVNRAQDANGGTTARTYLMGPRNTSRFGCALGDALHEQARWQTSQLGGFQVPLSASAANNVHAMFESCMIEHDE